MWQDAFITAITRAMRDIPHLDALWLGGSFGRGEADAYSDVDLIAVVAAEHQAGVAQDWRTQVEALVPIVLWYEARSGGAVHNAIGQGWERIDLLLTDDTGALQRTRDGTRCLIDHAGLYDRLAAHRDWPGPDRARVAFLIDEFLRVLGLLPVVLGRREYLAARAGLEMQRMALFQLLSETVERPDKGGMLVWSRRLPPDQHALLERLPQADLTETSLIAAYRAVATAFLPRARALAARWGIAWPTAFEAATRAHLRRSLGVEVEVSE